MIRLLALALVTAAPALAAPQFTSQRYTCDRGTMVPVTYVMTEDGDLAVLNVDGHQITLLSEAADTGARYAWPSDGANYVWLADGDAATLLWKEAGAETPLLTCTLAQ